jgi:mono/diheme cytochrome c family protein
MRKPLLLAAALFATTFAATLGKAPADPAAAPLHADGARLPAGPELLALQDSCAACHSFNMVTQQRLSATTWKAEVTKMRGFGAPLKAEQVPAVVAYLARYLGTAVPRLRAHPSVTAPPITYTEAPR